MGSFIVNIKNPIMKKKILTALALFFIFALAVFLRTYFCYGKVFSNPIKYSADDGVYHMRLVENQLLGGHPFKQLSFDPFTYFPNGTPTNMAPLYGYILAGVVWVLTSGRPTLESINNIAPFIPPILGSLVVFAAYFIGKSIWDKKTGVFAAFLAAISSEIIFKSLLGNTDHHVAEILFSSLAMLFLILALKKKSFFYAVLFGLFLGLYFLIWPGALLFLFIIFVFMVLDYLIEFLRGNNPTWILKIGILGFSVVLIMLLSSFGKDLFSVYVYGLKHFLALVLGILGLAFLWVAGWFIKKKNLKLYFLPIFSFAALILFLILFRFLTLSLFLQITDTFSAVRTGLVSNASANSMVAEMHPAKLGGVIGDFSSLFFLFLAGLVLVIYDFIKYKKQEYLLILVWSLVILLMTGIIPYFGAGRYLYYLAFPVCLLASMAVLRGIVFGWKSLTENHDLGSASLLLLIFLYLLYPFPFNLGLAYPATLPDILRLPLGMAQNGIIAREDDWYETLGWIKNNTPDPGLDYYKFYQKENFSYPSQAYGILAIWDIGHMMTYYTHRLPIANGFQEGIDKEAEFFLETNEQKAAAELDSLKVKYVICDPVSALPQGAFAENIKWVQGNLSDYGEKKDEGKNMYDNSMAARLYVLDGRGETTEREVSEIGRAHV